MRRRRRSGIVDHHKMALKRGVIKAKEKPERMGRVRKEEEEREEEQIKGRRVSRSIGSAVGVLG